MTDPKSNVAIFPLPPAPREPNLDAASDTRRQREADLIGGVLAHPATFPQVAELLSSEDFEDPMSMLAFMAMTEVAESGSPLTRQAVRSAMMGRWEDNQSVSAYLQLRNLSRMEAGRVLPLVLEIKAYAFDRRVRAAARWVSRRAEVNDRAGMLEAYARLREAFDDLAALTPAEVERQGEPSRAGGVALYRWFDAKGRLLYVGISGNLSSRQDSHSVRSSWSDFAADCQVVRYPTKALALAAEKEAIKSEAPIFNKTHNGSAAARQRLVDYLIVHGRTDLLTASVSRG